MSLGNRGAKLRGLRYQSSTLEESMAAYDRLPPELRMAVGNAPTKVNTQSVLRLYRAHGLSVALTSMRDHNEKTRAAIAAERQAVLSAQADMASALALLRQAGLA